MGRKRSRMLCETRAVLDNTYSTQRLGTFRRMFACPLDFKRSWIEQITYDIIEYLIIKCAAYVAWVRLGCLLAIQSTFI